MSEERIPISAEFPIFSAEQMGWILELCEEVTVAAGDTLLQDNSAAHAFVLVEGEVSLVRRADSGVERLRVLSDADGQSTPIVLNSPAIARAEAVTPTRLLRIDTDAYLDRLRGDSPMSNVLVSILVWRIQNAEAQLRQREKMAALGKMAAGLTHELNNPAAAVGRTAEQLGKAFQQLQTVVLHLTESMLGAAQVEEIGAAQCAALQRFHTAAAADPLVQIEREEALADWLTDHGVEDAWDLVPGLLLAAPDTAWLDRLATELPPHLLVDVLRYLAQSTTAMQLLAEIRQSSERISALVSAVKAYAYMDQAPLQEVDVHTGIENTLVILGYKLKKGVHVVREYAPNLPRVCAYGSELNQVWTNLIDNAVDAMNGRGTLWIRTWAGADDVLVEIADDGPGIPPQIQSRIFEPFFTTKDVGQGIGLGLDTAYRVVVDRHGGDLRFYSRPGDTRFQVRLPRQHVGDR